MSTPDVLILRVILTTTGCDSFSSPAKLLSISLRAGRSVCVIELNCSSDVGSWIETARISERSQSKNPYLKPIRSFAGEQNESHPVVVKITIDFEGTCSPYSALILLVDDSIQLEKSRTGNPQRFFVGRPSGGPGLSWKKIKPVKQNRKQ